LASYVADPFPATADTTTVAHLTVLASLFISHTIVAVPQRVGIAETVTEL
jgi:hypothetical protein